MSPPTAADELWVRSSNRELSVSLDSSVFFGGGEREGEREREILFAAVSQMHIVPKFCNYNDIRGEDRKHFVCVFVRE